MPLAYPRAPLSVRLPSGVGVCIIVWWYHVKTERINVTLPRDLLDEIDRVAGTRRRSAFLAEAAREKLARLRFDQAAAHAFGAWRDEDHPELATDADVRRFLEQVRYSTNRRVRKRLNNA